ncbi:acyl-CoA dehydrogenase family protein [Streptomyces sp. UNOC14_S4]|uniref:acyl-CoA dehydrogenase family protein n=1 Tax=Streptomyces sp. UNOC14_S4 TaxID=2872340 RepID=UPI001E615397|nr:acyl-CoA dehydrogenase family protein [Streptomyces sp. UNOC14_S4]MCC3767172.1 acyl-CoA dehydrogenase family protein [Streptomyces sp. UNOC14_S4]
MSTEYDPVALADDFECALGDPNDSASVFTTARSLALDAGEEFPEEIYAELDALGLPEHYVPREFGGRLGSYEELFQIMRRVAGRDLTVAIGHAATYLGTVCTWVGGTPAQARHTAREVMAGTVHSFALTERDHGSDLLAGDLSAWAVPGGYRLDGEKWLINNATRGTRLCVLARTDGAGGSRGFSLFTVDKRDLDADTYRTLPAVPTHGIRGTDISGISFTGAQVPAGAMIGAPGTGVETALKSLQLTRTLCAALSSGAADHALRIALDHGLGADAETSVILADAYADLLIAEAVGIVGARGIHSLTGELNVLSAAVKHYVPTSVDAMIKRLGAALGAEAHVTDGPFEKVARDHSIVGIFDGNSVVNLLALIHQFPVLVRGRKRQKYDAAGLAEAVTLTGAPPAFRREKLSLISSAGCSVMQAPDPGGPYASELQEIADELYEDMARVRPSARDTRPEAFELAERFTLLFAAAACRHLWAYNRELWADSSWLEACLSRLLRRLGRDAGDSGVLSPDLLRRYSAGERLSLLPVTRTPTTEAR